MDGWMTEVQASFIIAPMLIHSTMEQQCYHKTFTDVLLCHADLVTDQSDAGLPKWRSEFITCLTGNEGL